MGQAKSTIHKVEGYNGRLDAIQAGILEIKLKRLPSWNQARREAATAVRGVAWTTRIWRLACRLRTRMVTECIPLVCDPVAESRAA